MNDKFLKITALIFVILVIIIFLPYLKEFIVLKEHNPLDNVSVKLSQFTQETVTKISIKKGSEERILSFSENKWLIGNEEADVDKVKQFFQDLSDLKIKEMVSQNEENQSKFEVAKDKNSFQLTLWQNGKENVFFVGKSAAAVNDFYIRKDGIKNVYLVNGELRNKLSWDANQWKKANDDQEKK
ncbi:MAG: DUF4340 domain-containing protein [Rubrivivax sp.]|nr:DUF4340 domain-containing protein [Rubrivivax sp.]